MNGRSGQVAIYLVMVLVVIIVLVMMNVGTFLAVSAKNRAMNAGDAAALAVARHQGDLLRQIGQLNLDHLQAALKDDTERCREISAEQSRLCLLGPLDGLKIGSEWAYRNGIRNIDEEAMDVLRQHVADVRSAYAVDPLQYPAAWEGAWDEYATALEAAIAGGLYAAPDKIEFIDAAGEHLLLNPRFYDAIAGRNWCWFHFYARGVLEGYSGFGDWGPLPSADDVLRSRRCCNSEIYSLHLVARTGSAVKLLGEEVVRRLTEPSGYDVAKSTLLHDENQVWFFYGDEIWRRWWEIDPEPNAWNEGHGLPVVGSVRPEYDVRGCAAICRVMNTIPDVVRDAGECENRWTAAAKPFGLVLDERGELANAGFVTPVPFDQVRLVPWDSVGGRDLERPNLSMIAHVRRHLPSYLMNGTAGLCPGCYYCRQLQEWERPELRAEGREWLRRNSSNCNRAVQSGGRGGGTSHAH